jgi:hypothetical protein
LATTLFATGIPAGAGFENEQQINKWVAAKMRKSRKNAGAG